MELNTEVEKYLKNKNYEGLVTTIQDYCFLYPENNDLKLRLAILLQSVFIDDYPSALKIIESILKNSSNHIDALILKAYIEDTFQGQISDTTFDKINLQLENANLKGNNRNQLFVLKAYYFRRRDEKKYLSSLIDSTTNDVLSSHNYFLLYELLKSKGEDKKAVKALNHAIANVVHVYDTSEYIDFTDFKEFINEKIRGVHLSKVNYDSLIFKKSNL